MMSLLVLSTVIIGVATIGALTAKWIIQKYNETPMQKDEKKDDMDGSMMSRLSVSMTKRNSAVKIKNTVKRYKGKNPFSLKPLSTYSKFKIYFFCMTGIAFVRLLLFVGTILFAYIVSVAAKIIKPHSALVHRCLMQLVRISFACGLIIFGFYVPVSKQKRVSSKARVIVANHNTIFDGLFLLINTNGVVAAKKEISRIPLVGTILSELNTLWIDRHCAGGRNAAKRQIANQIEDESLPPLIIFPQGTISNIDTITAFKPGAFQKECIIQPVALDWSRNKSADLSYICSNNVAHLLYVGCCQFVNYCNVQILDEYKPQSQHERVAEKIREIIVEALSATNPDIDVTPHSFADVLLMRHESKTGNKAMSACDIVMDDIYSTLKFRTQTVVYLLEAFTKLDPDCSGYIDFEEFCQLFGDNKSKTELRYLFSLFDTKDDDEQIGFDEFLVGVATCYMDEFIEDAIKVMFKACCIIVFDDDGDEKKYVLKEHILAMYFRSVPEAEFDREWAQKVTNFCEEVFKPQIAEQDENGEKEMVDEEDERDRLKFQKFRTRVNQKKQHQSVVQHFLQHMFAARFNVKLKKEDFI